MPFSWSILGTTIGKLTDLLPWLTENMKTGEVHKKLVIRELRDNLTLMQLAYHEHIEPGEVIDRLNNAAIKAAAADNFNFNKLRKGEIKAEDIHDERNKRYIGWSTARLVDKIDEKVEELKLLRSLELAGKAAKGKNTTAIVTNLYFRMKLLVEIIRADAK
jgi:hypothetical protein